MLNLVILRVLYSTIRKKEYTCIIDYRLQIELVLNQKNPRGKTKDSSVSKNLYIEVSDLEFMKYYYI